MNEQPVSYAADIRPLFRQLDIEAMKRHGPFDLSLYEDVKANAADIAERLHDGDMPCDAAWPPAQLDLFDRWIREGMAP